MFAAIGKKTPTVKPTWLTKMHFAGDSTTADSNRLGNRSGYRQLFVDKIFALYNYLMNHTTDIVGIQNPNNTGTAVPYCGLSGIRSDQLLASYVGTGSGDGLDADKNKPKRVVLNIGFNDLLQDYLGCRTAPHTQLTTQIGLIIDVYKVADPTVQVVVCNLWDNSAQPAAFASAQAYIKSYIEGRGDYGVNSFVFDSFSAMGAYSGTYWPDITHLNNAGNVIFADALVARLRVLFEA